jgi:hypothetical protein
MSNKDNDNVKDEPLPMKRPKNWIEAPKPPIKAVSKKQKK